MTLVLAIVGISLLVVLHELGHMGVARAFGMRVTRFSVGFGPTLLSHRRGDTTWALAAIPLGGFVQIDGMGPPEETETPEPSAAATAAVAALPSVLFRDKPAWQRFLVILAGPASNYLVCAAILIVLGMTGGFSRFDESRPVLGELEATGAATAAGLREGDRIERIGGVAVHDWPELVIQVRAHPSDPVTVDLVRDGALRSLTVTPRPVQGVGVIEAAPPRVVETYGPLGALVHGVQAATRLTCDQARMLAGMVTGKAAGRLTGLPGIVKSVSKQAAHGLSRLFENLAWISASLCLLNILPVPALDGSRLFFLLVEMVRRRPVNERLENVIHTAGFMVLAALMLFVSVRDML